MKFNDNIYLIGGIYSVPNTNIDCFIEKLNYTNNPQGIYFMLDLMPLLAYRDILRAVGPKYIPIF